MANRETAQKTTDTAASGPDRREFLKLAVGGALSSTGLLASARNASAAVHKSAPGIKLCAQSSAKPTDEELLFLKQMGAEYVSVASTPDLRTAEGFLQIKKTYADAGITVWNIGNASVHNMPEVTLNLPGRDQKIEDYKQYLRNLGQAGIYYTTYAHMGNGIWSSGRATIRGSSAREFDMASPNKVGVWGDRKFYEPLSHGREFTKEEIWENYTYFIKQVAPVAEENSVRIGIHPDDPPEPVLAGVPRCIFANFEGYKRAMEIANSPNVGICLCCGCWNEGGPALMHKDPAEMIRYFGPEKIWKIHFRNVSAPLPHFVETFMDNGYYDMSKIMTALVEVNFDGIVILDHTPQVVGGHYPEQAYGFAYMKALKNRAQAEVKLNPFLLRFMSLKTQCARFLVLAVLLLSPAAVLVASAQAVQNAAPPCASSLNSEFPKAILSNGPVQAVIYLPDAQKGYYRSTRFDWSGVVACLTYKGHTYFGVWFNHYDPLINDSITGPVEEFRSSDGLSSMNYNEAKPGGLFIKPGVGVLRKVDDSPYKVGFAYPIVDGGKWTVRVKKTEVIFTHRLHSPLGIAYVYEKRLKLDKHLPVLTLEHHMKNTGKALIDTQVYDHDFFMLDGVPTGPGIAVHFPFEPTATRPLEPRARIDGKDLVYLQELQSGPGQAVTSYLTGFSNSPSDYDFTVENRNTGLGVEQTSDSAIAQLNFWSIRTTVCPEAYIHVMAQPGETKSWTIHYRFFAK